MSTWLLFLGVAFAGGQASDEHDLQDVLAGLSGDFDPDVHGIINGVRTDEWDQVVSLSIDSGGFLSSFCTGTLIHPEWVLTAAHCIDSSAASQFSYGTPTVVFGRDVNTGDIDRAVPMLDWIPHPTWSGSLEAGYDIGLVQLAEPVTAVEPQVVNDQIPDDYWVGTEVTFVGFGLTDPRGQETGVKYMTSMPISGVNEQFIEVNNYDTSTCQGDSGGPGFIQNEDGEWVLPMVVSWGLDGCAGLSGNSNVATFMDWIKQHVPDVMTEYPEPEDPTSSGGGSLDLSPPGDINGLGPRWETVRGEGATLGCRTGGSAPLWLGALLVPLAVRRRR